ncbi:MAG: tetratricopeptide repeat protein [Candidatus Melainabacteria bacterium]|nr:tetratricopeptide repeat protein [Candidatus Melainabacteria bacterium]
MKKFAAIAVEIVSAFAFGMSCTAGSAGAALSVESANTSDVLTRRGYVLVQSGSFKPAVAVLKNALQLNPNDVSARRYLSFALMQLGDYINAEEQLKVIGKIATLTAADYYQSGCINVRMGNNERALQEYKSALTLEPDMPAARAGIIELFVLASDFQGATFLCNDCLKKAKDRSQYEYFRKISEYIHAHQVALESRPEYVKPEGQVIISPTAITAPAPRDLIPQVIQSPLLAPPKIAPIATRAKA